MKTGYWFLDEEGRVDFVDQLTEQEIEEIMNTELTDEDVDLMFEYFNKNK